MQPRLAWHLNDTRHVPIFLHLAYACGQFCPTGLARGPATGSAAPKCRSRTLRPAHPGQRKGGPH